MREFNPIVTINGKSYQRIPIKTNILQKGDDILEIIKTYTKDIIQPGDWICISESPLAITQGRAVPVSEIKIGLLANILWRFVSNVKYGIGLRAPTSMQCAIDECGSARILFAAIVAAITKLFGRKGDFYRLAGVQAALVDAATTSPVPPYTSCVIKGPLHPEKEAQRIFAAIGNPTAVMDINDIGGSWMIGGSITMNKKLVEAVMRDNPQGQGDELTPICLVRELK